MRRESRSSWSAVERRANNELKRSSAIQGLGAFVLVCVGVGLGLKVVAGVKNIEEEQRKRYEEGLNNQACTGEVVDKTYTPEHEELSLIGRTPVLSKVPENRTITMQLGAGCRPYEAGDEIEINADSQLWDKANNGDMLYHPDGSTGWDVYDNYPVSMDDSTGSKENNPMNNNGDDVIVRDLPTVGTGQVSPAVAQEKYSEPAASEFYISPQALEEAANS